MRSVSPQSAYYSDREVWTWHDLQCNLQSTLYHAHLLAPLCSGSPDKVNRGHFSSVQKTNSRILIRSIFVTTASAHLHTHISSFVLWGCNQLQSGLLINWPSFKVTRGYYFALCYVWLCMWVRSPPAPERRSRPSSDCLTQRGGSRACWVELCTIWGPDGFRLWAGTGGKESVRGVVRQSKFPQLILIPSYATAIGGKGHRLRLHSLGLPLTFNSLSK